MGLDIFLYRVKKADFLKENSVVIDENYDNLRLIPVFKDKNKIDYCPTILNNSIKVKKNDRMINLHSIYEKYSKEHKKEEDIHIGGWGNGNYYIYIDGERHEISASEIKENHSYIERHDYYACLMEEVAYQRGLPDEGWECLPENCEYCDDTDVLSNLLDNGLDSKFKNEWKDESTVLLAWW